MVNLPSASAITPVLLPFTRIDTRGNGLRSSDDTTLPEIIFVCASAVCQISDPASKNSSSINLHIDFKFSVNSYFILNKGLKKKSFSTNCTHIY
jgi:hypothetical protein